MGRRGPRWRCVTAAGCPCLTGVCVQAPLCTARRCWGCCATGAGCPCLTGVFVQAPLCTARRCWGCCVTAAGCSCLTCVCVQAPLCTARRCWGCCVTVGGAVRLQLAVPVSHVSVSRHHYALPSCASWCWGTSVS